MTAEVFTHRCAYTPPHRCQHPPCAHRPARSAAARCSPQLAPQRYPPARSQHSAREESPNSPPAPPLLPGEACPAPASRLRPRCCCLYFPLPAPAGRRQEPGWGAAPLPGTLGFVGSRLGWRRARAWPHFPAGAAVPAATGHPGPPPRSGEGAQPSSCFLGKRGACAQRPLAAHQRCSDGYFCSRGIYSVAPALGYIIVVVLTENTGVPVRERLAACAGSWAREKGWCRAWQGSAGARHSHNFTIMFSGPFSLLCSYTLP